MICGYCGCELAGSICKRCGRQNELVAMQIRGLGRVNATEKTFLHSELITYAQRYCSAVAADDRTVQGFVMFLGQQR